MKRSLFLVFLAALTLVALSVPLGQTSASAALTCAGINGQAYDTSFFIENFTVNLKAGEVIGGVGITVQDPTFNSAQDVFVEINSNPYTDGVGPFSWSYTAPSTASYDVLVQVTGGEGQFVSGSWTCDSAASPKAASVTLPPQINDNRENSYDLAAPVAIYDYSKFLDVYAINPENSEGSLVIHYALADRPAADGQLHTLRSGVNPFTGQQIVLYLLADGSLQVNTVAADGKPYVFNWK